MVEVLQLSFSQVWWSLPFCRLGPRSVLCFGFISSVAISALKLLSVTLEEHKLRHSRSLSVHTALGLAKRCEFLLYSLNVPLGGSCEIDTNVP